MVYPSKQRYDKKNFLKVNVAFNRKTEPEIAAFVESKEKKAEYIRQLVRDDFNRTGKSK